MSKEEKINEILNNSEKLTKAMNEYTEEFDEIEFDFIIDGEPKPYARERYTKFGGNGKGRFYNKRAQFMKQLSDQIEHSIPLETTEVLNEIINKAKENKQYNYYVSVDADFFIKIPTSDSIKTTVLKEQQIILPVVSRGDVDNYNKLLLDVLHNIAYHDDKHVISQKSSKYYSINPRLEVHIKIKYRR